MHFKCRGSEVRPLQTMPALKVKALTSCWACSSSSRLFNSTFSCSAPSSLSVDASPTSTLRGFWSKQESKINEREGVKNKCKKNSTDENIQHSCGNISTTASFFFFNVLALMRHFFFHVCSVVPELKTFLLGGWHSNQSARRAPRQNPALIAGNVGGWRWEHFQCASGRPPGWCSSPAARPPAASPCRAPEPRTHTRAVVKEKKIELHRAHTEARVDIFHQMPLKYHKSASAKHQNKIGISFKIR